jgi:hypothetical protein
MIEEDALIKQAMGVGLRRSGDAAVLSEKAIRSAVAWASDEKRAPPYVEREDDILVTTSRLRFEIDYLRSVARYAVTVLETP